MPFTITTTARNDAVSVQTTQPNSLETIAGNVDLLNEILLRLPVKALIKFKSVSKHWLSLISDPKFSQRYKSNPNPNPISASGLFLKHSSQPEYEFINLDKASKSNPCRGPFRSLNFSADEKFGVRVVQSCNGLLLCSTDKTQTQTRGPREYYVYNPTVNQYTILPPTWRISLHSSMHRSGLSLAFDPRKSPHYHVVYVWTSRNRTRYNQVEIEIYSSETRQWGLCSGSFDINGVARFDGGVFWKGSVHWICVFGESVYFNVEEGKLSTMPMPPVPDYWDHARKCMYFGESRGHLHLIDHNFDPQMPHFDVYEMKMDYSGWIVKFRVDFSNFPERRMQAENLDENDKESVFSVVCVVQGEVEKEESYLVLQTKSSVIRYNLGSTTFEKICDVEASSTWINEAVCVQKSAVKMLPSRLVWYGDVHQFIESFALV